MTAVKCLRVNAVEEEELYLSAVHDVIRCILADKDGRTLIDISETIGVEVKTISNAFNRKHRLSQVFLNRLGLAFGVHCLDPVAKLSGGRMVPLDHGNCADILPMLTRASCKIAEARDPASPSGPRETHTEKLRYLPELKRLYRELGKVICEVEGLAA
jgi:hypothetical protein